MLTVAPPAADHDLLAAAAFRFRPVIAASGFVRRIGALGDDAFQSHPAGGIQHLLAGGLVMLDIPVARRVRQALAQQFLQQRLALRESGTPRRSWPSR